MWQILAAAPRRPQRDVVHDPSITAVIPALVAGSIMPLGSAACGWLDTGDKPRYDTPILSAK
jgi:hypothetical protein